MLILIFIKKKNFFFFFFLRLMDSLNKFRIFSADGKAELVHRVADVLGALSVSCDQ